MSKKYNRWLGDDSYDARLVKSPPADYAYLRQSQNLDDKDVSREMLLTIRGSPGFFLGLPGEPGDGNYISIPQGTEGNVVVVGGNGSGKSAGIAKPTLRTWQGAICVTDIKGELSDFYAELYLHGLVNRPYIIFDPMQIEGPSYDPFWLLEHDSPDNLFNNVKEIAIAIAPVLPDDKQPFWAETEQGVLTARKCQQACCCRRAKKAAGRTGCSGGTEAEGQSPQLHHRRSGFQIFPRRPEH